MNLILKAVLFCLLVTLVSTTARAADLIEAFTTSPGWIDPETEAEILTGFTVGGNDYSNPQFVTTTATTAADRLWGTAASDPGDAITAIIDNRLDTGSLNFGNGVDFDFTSSLSSDDQIFVFWNGPNGTSFFDQPTSVSAFNSGGTQIGSAVTLPTLTGGVDVLGLMNAARAGGGPLNNRAIYGLAIDPAEFGATIADITRVNFTATGNGLDLQMVGFASLGAAPTAAEWAATGGGGWGTAGNWDINAVPSALDTTFGSAITGNATITLGEDRSVANLIFDDNNSYTLSGNTLSVSGDVSAISGTHTISSTVQFSGGTRMLTSSAGASLNISGTTQTAGDAAATIVLDGAGGGSLGAIRDNNDVGNPLDGTDNINIVKRGTGTWTIGSGSTTLEDFHGGNTTIEAGTLKVNGGAGSTGELRSPTISVQAGATLDTSDFGTYSLAVGQSLNGGGTIDAGGSNTVQIFSDNSVTVGDGGTGTLSVTGNLALNGVEGSSPSGGLVFELSDSSAGANDQIAVSGNVISNAGTGRTAISIIPTGASLDSSYELITFGGNHTGSAADYQIDASLQTRFTQSISVDSDSVNLDIAGSNASLIWNGNINDDWNVNSTANWQGGEVFFDLDNVTFNDTASGSGTVNVATTVSPASSTIDNSSKDYTFAGTGAIAGAGSVTKTGSGRLTISNANTYTGTTTITGGTLHAANNNALGSTAGGTTVNGGTLDITGTNIGNEVVTIEGTGDGGKGALITDGLDSLGGGTRQLSHVVQSGPATIGAFSDQPAGSIFEANDYRWDLEPSSNFPNVDASWQGNGHTLTKVGRGTVSIQRTGDMGGGDINIQQGVMFWQGNTTSAGATVTIGDGVNRHKDALTEETGTAALNTFYFSGTGPAPVGGHDISLVLQGGSFSHQASTGFQDTSINGTVVNNDVTGDDTIDNQISATNGNTVAIVNGITGDGDLRFASGADGVVELQGNSTYSGRTEVTGILALTGSGQLSGTPRIELTRAPGATAGAGIIDASGRSDGTFAIAGQTLAIGGVAAATTGSVTVQVTSFQDTVMRYNPQDPDADGPDADGDNQLFAGVINPNTQNGSLVTDSSRSIMEFDLSSVPVLATVTDVDDVSLTLQNGSDAGSAGTIIGVEIHELQQAFVDTEASANEASSGVPWTGYTGGGPDPNAAAGGALGDLVSVVSAAPGAAGTIVFPDNQAGAPFQSVVESALAGDGSVKLLIKVDDAAETTDRRDLFRFADEGGGSDPVLDITFNGTIANTLTASIVGDLAMDASSTLEVDVFNDIFTDLLDVTGAADLNGTLDANLISGSPLAVNDTVTVLTAAGGITDSGLSVAGPFSHSIVGNDLVLTFLGISGLAGDFNADGVVDAADYTVWRDNLGAADETALNGNGNGADGVDSADYALWKANFGNTSGAGAGSRASVPEPTSITLLLLSLAAVCGAARRS